MFSKTHELMIESIFALRSWCKDNLPIENSLIAYDLILVLAINNYAKNNISIKELFASVPHSYTAVRGHYLRFVNDGWVEHYLDESDERIKYVRPTARLVKTMNEYAKNKNTTGKNNFFIYLSYSSTHLLPTHQTVSFVSLVL